MSDPVFRSYQDAFALSEQDIDMAAPNAQPARRGGAGKVSTHGPHSGSGTNDGVGDGKGGDVKRGSTPKGTGKNKNRLH